VFIVISLELWFHYYITGNWPLINGVNCCGLSSTRGYARSFEGSAVAGSDKNRLCAKLVKSSRNR